MKSKYAILASVLLMSMATFAQKDQIKAAEKALKSGSSQEALTILQGAESLLANAKEADKIDYYLMKAKVLVDLANKKFDTSKNLLLAGQAYQDVITIEAASGKNKNSVQAAAGIAEMKGRLVNESIANSKVDKYAQSANDSHNAYLLDKKDTINLYYAAIYNLYAKDDDNALKFLTELKNLKYSGKKINYYAVNKINNQKELFGSLEDRDKMVKLKTYEKPTKELEPSKRGEIYKQIAYILVRKGKTEEAKKAIAEARKTNPKDNQLILDEANLYLQTKDFDTYKKLITEAVVKNPNDANLFFNLAVISSGSKNIADAEKYYLKAIEIDPKYINAYINLAALKLENEKAVIDQMNKLGNTPKEMKRYNELKTQREGIYKSAIPYLQKAIELDPKDQAVAKTLLSVYNALEMTEEAKVLKAKIKAMDVKK